MNAKLLTAFLCGLAACTWAQSSNQSRLNIQLASAASSSVALLDSNVIFDGWNPAQNKWGYSFKLAYSYNTYNKEDGEVMYNLTTAGWQDAARYANYQFDSQHNCLEKIYELFYNHSWNLSSKEQSTYDATNHELTHLYLSYTGSAWNNDRQDSNTYTGNNLATHTVQLWDVNTMAWKNWFRESHTYNTSDQQISQLTERWKGGAWVDSTLETHYVYSGTDLISLEIEAWDTLSHSFKANYKYTYSYDVNHHLQNLLIEKWDATTNTWKNDKKADYTTDASGNINSFLARDWNAGSSTWVNAYKSLYYYRNGITGIGESGSNKHSPGVSPNPATTFVEISGADWQATVYLSDLSGKVLISEQVEDATKAKIDIGSLAPGLYLLNITTPKERFNRKIIKQ